MKYEAVVFDWAGTMIDFGSFAPMGVFVEVFAEFDIEVSIAEARAPMGKPKWDHIKAMLEAPRVSKLWEKRYGTQPSDQDVDQIYSVFVPRNEEIVANYAELVPGALDMLQDLASRNLKIGSTTGYTRSIMERVLPVAEAQGYRPANLVCADDLPFGRPTALGMYKCCIDLAVDHTSKLIKVDDTVPGILEGVAAGCLTVGVTLSGNSVGLTHKDLSGMSPDERQQLSEKAGKELLEAGADFVIDTVADLPELLTKLETFESRPTN